MNLGRVIVDPASGSVGRHASSRNGACATAARPTDARTTLQVAAAIGRSVAFTERLLEDEAARGLVQRAGDGWRLSEHAAVEFGPFGDVERERV